MRLFIKDGVKHYIGNNKIHSFWNGKDSGCSVLGKNGALNEEQTIKRLIELGFKEIIK